MNEPQIFKATGEMVILSRADYAALVKNREEAEDLRAFDEGVEEIEAGAELYPADFVARLMETDSRLREWRKYRGKSQAQLAEAVGVRQATISAIELGTVPRLDNARRIAEALKCDIDDLF